MVVNRFIGVTLPPSPQFISVSYYKTPMVGFGLSSLLRFHQIEMNVIHPVDFFTCDIVQQLCAVEVLLVRKLYAFGNVQKDSKNR